MGFSQNFDANEVKRIREWLQSYGFVQLNDRLVKNLGVEAKKGFDPDRLVVRVCTEYLVIKADFAIYRGKKSMLDPSYANMY